MPKRFALILTFTLGMLGASHAQQFDERQAQAACQDDAFRLCQATIPDRDRTLACLIQNKTNLSGACRTVLAELFPPEPAAKRKKSVKQQQRSKGAPVDLAPTASR